MSIPTDEAWAYFMKHHDDIRSVVEDLLPVPRMEVPNTRGPVPTDEHSLKVYGQLPPQGIGEQHGALPLEIRHTIADFDTAVAAKDSGALADIMNDAWFRAPESRDVYRIPGFTQMCNLLDCTVDGFIPEAPEC